MDDLLLDAIRLMVEENAADQLNKVLEFHPAALSQSTAVELVDHALTWGSQRTARLLIARGFPLTEACAALGLVDAPTNKVSIGKDGRTLLHLAAMFDNEPLISRLANPDLANQQDDLRADPLHYACERAGISSVECLLAVATTVTDSHIRAAARGGRPDVIRAVVNNSKWIRDPSVLSICALEAASRNMIAALNELMLCGADPNHHDSDGRTLLSIASSPFAAALLENYGATHDLFSAARHGVSPLLGALLNRLECIYNDAEETVNHYAALDPTLRSLATLEKSGFQMWTVHAALSGTPLHWAAKVGNLEACEFLCARLGDEAFFELTADGSSILECAMSSGCSPCIDWLAERARYQPREVILAAVRTDNVQQLGQWRKAHAPTPDEAKDLLAEAIRHRAARAAGEVLCGLNQ